MSRSAPAAPGYLQGAIKAVEGVLRDSYPKPMTAREIAEALNASGFRWPMRPGYDQFARRWRGPNETGVPTPDRVRRVCDMTGNKTSISHEGKRGAANTYSLYPWAV